MEKAPSFQRVGAVCLMVLMPLLTIAQETTEGSKPPTKDDALEGAALATSEKCRADIAHFCSDVTPGGPNGDVTTLAFHISQRNKDRWNYLLGFNWDLNKSWSIMAEAGFGGSRENFIGGVTYRL